MEKLSEQHGFDAATIWEDKLHGINPDTGKPIVAWDKRRDALKAMHATVNQLIDKIAELEERQIRPFA